MALSNWDTLAFGPDGKPCGGDHTFGKTTVSIYKNWVYVYNEELWKEGYGFTKPCIAEIHHGDIDFAAVNIVARRHTEQNAVFMMASQGYGKERVILCGIGCSGYIDVMKAVQKYLPDEWAKIPDELKDPNKYHVGHYSGGFGRDENGYWGLSFFPEGEGDMVDWRIEGPDPTGEYVGVEPETVKAFLEWMAEQDCKEYTASLQPGVRFNQGDAFFAVNAGTPLQESAAGAAETPVLTKMLDARQHE